MDLPFRVCYWILVMGHIKPLKKDPKPLTLTVRALGQELGPHLKSKLRAAASKCACPGGSKYPRIWYLGFG